MYDSKCPILSPTHTRKKDPAMSKLKKIRCVTREEKLFQKSYFHFLPLLHDILFMALGLDIGRKWSHFLKGLEITYQSIFLSDRSDNIKSVKKNKAKYGRIKNIFLRRWVWISVRCSHIFLKVLKLFINHYFFPSK